MYYLVGKVVTGDTLLLGPDNNGTYIPVLVKSIHRKRVVTNLAFAGQSVTFALKKIKRSTIRKGMVMLRFFRY